MSLFVGEIGSCHNGSITRLFKLIDISKEIGCDAIKLQMFKANKLYHPDHIDEKTKAELHKRELNEMWIEKISEYCKEIDIKLGITPFDITSLFYISTFVDFIKISSYDILRVNLISNAVKLCLKYNIPLVVSTGMADMNEVMTMVKMINHLANNSVYSWPLKFYLLHCSSFYPTQPEQCNLNMMKTMKGIFHTAKIGWSDHSVESGVVYKAVEFGAEMIEFHIDLEDGKGYENIGHCWTPSKMKEVIRNIQIGKQAEGSHLLHEKNDLCCKGHRADSEDGLRPTKEERIKCDGKQ